MDLLKSVFFSVLFSLSCLSSSEEVQSGQHNGKAYGNILKTMKLNNSMDLQNLTALLKSLGLHDCSNKADHRHKCVTAKSLFELYNIATTSSLKETDFAKVATVIVHSLLPPRTRKRSTRFVTKYPDVYEELLERYSTSELCEQILDHMLRDLNESIGKQLNNYKCFSSLEILNEMNISSEAEITKNKFPELSTIIISKLLNKHCIKVGYQNPLPCPSFFLNNMFKKYAQKKYINKTKIEKMLGKLKIGKQWSKDAAGQEGMDVNHNIIKNRIRNIYDKCYSVDELFSIYHADKKTGFEVKRFERLSTALLEQIESNACFLEQVGNQKENKMNKISTMSVWGFGLAAVSVVSLCSLVMIIPLMKTSFYQKSLIFLISLAVGTLVGDACLHLLPHATGFHHHPDSTLKNTDKSYLWRFLSAAAGIYGLFIFETSTHLLFFHKSNEVTPGDNKSTGEKEHTDSKPEIIDKKSQLPRHEKQPVVLLNKITLKEDGYPLEKFKAISNLDIIIPEKTPIAPMAWTIIIGDTLHNIADGIAIGVAFSDSIFGGVSTSIAVLCHEVPHELGDFVVLLSAGMNVRQALLANFISALFCFLGYVLGKLIGEIENVNLWILGITAGFFLYIALTNKLPELMHVSAHSDLPRWVILILQNTGIILGVAGMFFLAYYKKDINF